MNVVGLMGLVENMTGPAAYKLGDVLTARNGRTIEVHNTDAEGRLVLADVLNVAVETGRGEDRSIWPRSPAPASWRWAPTWPGLMTNDQPWCDTVAAAARVLRRSRSGNCRCSPSTTSRFKSEVADIKNVGEGRWGGAITAAKFLEQFVDKRPWTHIDIAGPAFNDKPKPWTDGGGSGALVRTLVEVARLFSA